MIVLAAFILGLYMTACTLVCTIRWVRRACQRSVAKQQMGQSTATAEAETEATYLERMARRLGPTLGWAAIPPQSESTPQDCRHSRVEVTSDVTWKPIYKKCLHCDRLDTRGSWQRTT